MAPLVRTRAGIAEAGRSARNTTLQLDWIAAVLGVLLTAGVYLDAWSHEHGFVDDTFWTPWHGRMYTAMAMYALFLLWPFVRALLAGTHWQDAAPAGYGLSLAGALVFAAGGIGDLVWHTLFGIENDLEALLSPTHLLLGIGWFLLVGGPFRAGWRRVTDDDGRAALFPALLSLTWMLSVPTFFTIYITPFGHLLAAVGGPSGELAQGLGVSAVPFQAALLMGAVLLALRRWQLPTGSLATITTLNAALVAALHDLYLMVPLALLAGALGDALVLEFRPSIARPLALRVVAAALPTILAALYFAGLAVTTGIAWTVHLWAGAIVLAGITGLLVSYVAFPPAMPTYRR